MQVLLTMQSLKFQPYLQAVPRQSVTSDPVIRRVSLRLPDASRTTHEPGREKKQYFKMLTMMKYIYSFIHLELYPDLGLTGSRDYPVNTGLKEKIYPAWNASP